VQFPLPLEADRVLRIIRAMAQEDTLDSGLVALVADIPGACLAAAVAHQPAVA
jgi:predicted RNase H-like nuclease